MLLSSILAATSLTSVSLILCSKRVIGKTSPKGACTQIVYTLAVKYPYRSYAKGQVDTIRVHGPLGFNHNTLNPEP